MTLKRLLGLDTRAERYAYGVDPEAGYVSAQKVPDRWVATTCGYCSVGCGMFIGVKDGRAVSVRGNPDHPVNRGMLCPKGLSEHHTHRRDEPRAVSAAAQRTGVRPRRAGTRRSTTMAARFRDVQARYGPDAVGVISTGQLVTEEFYALGKLVQLGLGTRNYDGNTTLCMSTAVAGYKRSFGSDGPPGAYEDLETRRRHPADRRQHRREPSDPLPAARRPIPAPRSIVVDPRVTKTAMMADLHLPIRPRSDLALLNGLIHIVIEHDLVDREYIERAHDRLRRAARVGARATRPSASREITGLDAGADLPHGVALCQRRGRRSSAGRWA